MFYESELRFLCEVFHKSRVRAIAISREELPIRLDEYRADGMQDPNFDEGGCVYRLLADPEPRTVYRYSDIFHRCFLFLQLPLTDTPTTLLIGPYLTAPISREALLMLGERIGISPQKQRYLSEYYQSIAVAPLGGALMVMFNTFCERIWNSPAFSIVDVAREHTEIERPIYDADPTHGAGDALVNMRTMEMRYAYENELIRAVSLGQLHKEDRLFAAISDQSHFEKRVADPLRNAQNYTIIMNTLLRKAAERGGVHPVYIDRLSSDFAQRIENLPSLSECTELMRDMFRSYCRMVRRHAVQKYSLVVQKTILIIDADLSADLSPGLLASSLGISLGYLSTVFHRETGKTLSEYVRERRMDYAAYLLGATDLQIQTVALHCGIMDVQYFSKLFKKQKGMTPTEFRLSGKSEQKM